MPLRLNDSVTLVIDIHKWMSETGRFSGVRATGREWIQACCVFHDDRHASFAVNSETGAYRCQACGASGSFVALVAHVEGHASFDEAESDLIVRYGRFVPDVDEALELDFGDAKYGTYGRNERGEETFVDIEEVLDQFDWNALDSAGGEYLRRRGLTNDTLRAFDVYVHNDAVVFPWFDARRRLVTMKYRSTTDKRFWYDPPITPGRLRRLLYGFHLAKDADMIVVCEGEIDAMSVAQAGYAAVALGGATFHDAQATLLRNSKASEIVVFTDNDDAGRKVRGAIVDKLVGEKRVSVVDWSSVVLTVEGSNEYEPHGWKDANDALRSGGEDAIRYLVEHRIPVGLSLRFD